MINYNVKFVLNIGEYGESSIEKVFNRAKNILNWQFDENFNVKLIENNINYQMMDVSDLKRNEIEKIITSFFDVTFDNIIDVELYKFLVLKDNNELQVLANISSLIFDYASINEFCELFIDLNKIYPKYDLDLYYNDIKNYLNSSNFEKDSIYWKNHISNSGDYIKFYNLNENKYKSQIINVNKSSLTSFIKNYDCSIYEFYGSIFALYLSFIDRFNGCLFKTTVHPQKNDLNTILKIDVNKNNSFIELLNEFNSSFKNAMKDTKVDVDNYLDENVSYYSIYDFSDLNENIDIYNSEDSALTLNIYENYLELVYNTKLFSDVYIEHMVRNIEKTIDEILNYPEKAITGINLISDEEKSLLEEFCKGEYDEVDEDEVLCEVFRKHATDNPEAIAVDDGVNQISYGELEKSSNSIAYDLKENYNITSDSRVALMLQRNYRFLEMVLALNKIGASFIPIDPIYPGKRVEHMLNIADATCIITASELKSLINFKIDVILIDDLNRDNEVDFNITCEIEDLFSILFTSGTTGIPKGVMISNKQVVGLTFSFEKIFGFSEGEVCGCYLSFSFIASCLIYATFYLGGCCRIFNENEQKNILSVVKTLKEKPMNNLILPPSIGIPIFENGDLKLDYLVLAGAKLNELVQKDSNTQIANFYGTTEVAFAITKIYDSKDVNNSNLSIGRPVTNTWGYILDENNRQMPVGVAGEICISSEYISPGYFNNPELTRKSFVENPYSTCKDNKIMYRTGDIGFYNFEGEIEIIGREDDQLSVRGFRIEKDEILNIIWNFEEITDVYIDVENDNLIAYYTANDEFNIEGVKEALKEELPYYMIPSFFIKLDKIPLTLNGKIDRTKLKSVVNNENIEITDEVIGGVVDAFKKVLELDSVLIDDDFVALGGNSLSAMKLQLLLKERFGVSLSSNELIRFSTPKDIADHIKYNLKVHSAADENKYSFDDLCPLSESQLNVYLDESVNTMGTAYNNSFKIDFKNDFSCDDIKKSLNKLFEVFPILKARVVNNEGVLSFDFNSEPEIKEGSLNDINTFVKPFKTDEYLSRFLIVEADTSLILCADFHHLIFDGTSLNILLSSFISILNNENLDFVDNGILRQVSFEENIDSEYMDNAQKFFDEMLESKDEVYELLPSVNDNNVEFELNNTFDIDMENLNSFLQKHSITHNQFFTSIFAYTLSRFSGSEKVLFNIVEDGRSHIDLSGSVGMFVKTLPVIMDCKNQYVHSFLEYSSNLINSAMTYDLYPFRVLAHEYGLNSNILFQYSHDLFSDVYEKTDFDYDISELKHDLDADFSFYIFNNGRDRLTIRIFHSSKYSKMFIEHFAESYWLILNEIIEVEELKDINYTSLKDYEFLDSYNQTEHQLVYEDILDAFNVNLQKYPENELVCYNNVSYSYGEGAYIADKIARRLTDLGVNSKDCVSFFVERSELYVFCILGIMSVGGVYVPLDDTLPDNRITLMLNDTQSKVVIVSDETYGRAKNIAGDSKILNVSDIIGGEIGSLSNLPIEYGDLACILYTSGTTGVPNGVKITRKAVINFAEFYIKKYGLSSEDVFALFASISFDVAMESIFSSIYAGACLNIIPNDIRFNMNAMNEYFIKYNITFSHLPAQIAKLFINENNTSLKVLCTGGEKLGEIEHDVNYRFVDSYGPTETFIDVTSIDVDKKIDKSSIGHLFDNIKAYVLDKENRRVPIGAVGELCIAGYQVADGYLNRDEETEKAFIDNPFDDSEDYNVLYRTGDLVRVLPDASFGFIGRNDNQVKIRGNRVELSEVESVIREMEDIKDVTVQTIKNGTNKELVAYVVVSNNIENIKDAVCDYVFRYKPDYMVPSFVIELNKIPLNINGKVDKRALPEVDLNLLHADYVPPRNEKEENIVEAFEKVFDMEKVSIHDDFIRLGGDSLTAIKLLHYIDSDNITMADILSLRTPEAIAKNMDDLSFDLDIYSLEEGCPLNAAQINVLADVTIYNKTNAYHIPNFIKISKKHSLENILDVLDKLLDVHPILSMHVSKIYEVNKENGMSNLELIRDSLSIAKKFGIKDIMEIVKSYGIRDVKGLYNMLQTAMKLLKGEYPYLIKGEKPPISVHKFDKDILIDFASKSLDLYDHLSEFMIMESEDSYYLFFMIHHIIFDATSQQVFNRNFQTILDGGSVGLDDTFLKVSAFTHHMKNTEKFDEAGEFFGSLLVDVNEAENLVEENPSATGYRMSRYDFEIDEEKLNSYLKNEGVSANVLFTSIFAYALSKFVKKDKVLFTIIENGRDRFNEDFIDMTSNVMPLLIDCKDQSINTFLENTADIVYGAMNHSYYPILLLYQKYNFEVKVLFQYIPDWVLYGIEDIEDISSAEIINHVLKSFDDFLSELFVQVNQKGKDISLIVVNSKRYSDEKIKDLMETYVSILSKIIYTDGSYNLSSILNNDFE